MVIYIKVRERSALSNREDGGTMDRMPALSGMSNYWLVASSLDLVDAVL